MSMLPVAAIEADDENVAAVFKSVMEAKQEDVKDVHVIACTELMRSTPLSLAGAINSDFCHDYLLVQVTTVQVADDGEENTHKYQFELHYLDDGKVHMRTPDDDEYEIDADEWYATEGVVPAEFVVKRTEGKSPKDLLLKAVEHASHFGKNHDVYDLQLYNCQSFVKTVFKSIKDGKYQLVVDPTVRFWKMVGAVCMRTAGVYDKRKEIFNEVTEGVVEFLRSLVPAVAEE